MMSQPPSPHTPEFAFVIPSYNGAGHLRRCVASIRERVARGSYVLVVMDDASSDEGVREVLARLRESDDTVVRVSDRNRGFCRNVNLGISLVLRDYPTVRYLVLLNQDTELQTDITAEAAAVMSETEGAGICGPRLLHADGRVQNSFYDFPTVGKTLAQLAGLRRLGSLARRVAPGSRGLRLLPSFARTYLANHRRHERPLEVPWLCGACLVVAREVFARVGLLDEGFRMYCEDMDFCRRARAAGWKVLLFPQGRVVHHGNLDHTLFSPDTLATYHRSMKRFHEKYSTGTRRRLLLVLNRVEQWKMTRS